MKFSCEKCGARYSIPDEKVQGKVLKVRCKKCTHVILVRWSNQTQKRAPKKAKEDKVQWYVAIKGKQHGPMTQDGVVALFKKGRIRDRSFVWNKGLKEWTRLLEIDVFKPLLAAEPATTSAPPPPVDSQQGLAEPAEQTQTATAASSSTASATGESSTENGSSFKEAVSIEQPKANFEQSDQEQPSIESSGELGASFESPSLSIDHSSPFSKRTLAQENDEAREEARLAAERVADQQAEAEEAQKAAAAEEAQRAAEAAQAEEAQRAAAAEEAQRAAAAEEAQRAAAAEEAQRAAAAEEAQRAAAAEEAQRAIRDEEIAAEAARAAEEAEQAAQESADQLIGQVSPEEEAQDLAAAFDQVMGTHQIPSNASPASDADDPFANVPTADQPHADFGGMAENTRIFMMRAGLHNRKKKQMTYAVACAVVICSLGSAMALDYYGVIKIPFLHSVTNFVVEKTNLPPPKRKLASWDETASDPNEACKLLGNCPKEKKKTKRRGKKKDKLLGVNLDGAFQGLDAKGNKVGRASLGSNGMANIDPFSKKDRSQELNSLFGNRSQGRLDFKDKFAKDESQNTSSLDAENVSKVVRGGQEGIKQCLEAAIKRQEKVKGNKKKRLILTINPNGRVGKAVFTDPILNAQPLGECILTRAKRWKFAPFAGEPTEVELPVILTTGM